MTEESLKARGKQKLEEGLRLQWEALGLSGLTPAEAGKLIERTELGDDYEYEAVLQAWQFGKDASAEEGVPKDGKIAALFLDAGTHITTAFGHLYDPSYIKEALGCLHLAISFARQAPGRECREIELSAAHEVAYAYLTLAEMVGGKQAEDARLVASRYFELQGFLQFQLGEYQKSASSYGTAVHRFRMSSRFEKAVHAAQRRVEALQPLGKSKGAADAQLELAEVMTGAAESGKNLYLQKRAVEALIDAGRLFAELDAEKPSGAGLLMEAGRRAVGILRADRKAEEPAFQRRVLRALGQSRLLYESMGDFDAEDQCHDLASRIRREGFLQSSRLRYASPNFLFSYLLAVVWGYGTRPWRLLPTAVVITLAFWGMYAMAGDLHWMGGSFAGLKTMPYALTALVLSVKALLPTQLLEWMAKVAVLPQIGMGPVSKVLALIESALGLVLAAMAAFSVSRWIKRQLPSGH
jgi:hypothetical protein